MERLIHPARWGGLCLGSVPELGPAAPKADKASAKFALHALGMVLDPGVRPGTFADYHPGSTFDPGEHQPGTVASYIARKRCSAKKRMSQFLMF